MSLVFWVKCFLEHDFLDLDLLLKQMMPFAKEQMPFFLVGGLIILFLCEAYAIVLGLIDPEM